MLTLSNVSALWLAACPSFAPVYAASYQEWGADSYYAQAGDFAHHLLALQSAGKREEFPAVAQFIERLLVEGDQPTREFAIVGILEAIQNVWGHTQTSPEEFSPFLLPVSTQAWQNLNRFWRGECLRADLE